MTVVTQFQQTLAGLKSAQASFEGFSIETENEKENKCINKPHNKPNN